MGQIRVLLFKASEQKVKWIRQVINVVGKGLSVVFPGLPAGLMSNDTSNLLSLIGEKILHLGKR